MKKYALILLLFLSNLAFGQTKNLHLTNALVIGQMDKEDEIDNDKLKKWITMMKWITMKKCITMMKWITIMMKINA